MLKDITLGQFFPGNSIVHRTDPRVKIVLVIAMIVSLLLASGVFSYALMAIYLFVIIAVSKVHLKMVVRGLKPIFMIVVITDILNIFYTAGDIIWQFGLLHITKQGINAAIEMVVRIMLLIIGTSMLTYTTSPIDLTEGLERLMSPLKKIHVPVHELAMVMSIALRFIPTLIEETEKIISAQKARGADFETGSILKRAKAMVPILVPLFISSIRRAEELATAMECRLYRGDVGRTRMKQLKICSADYISMTVSVIVFAGTIILGSFGL